MTSFTFPRALPDELKVVGIRFLPSPMIEVSPTRGGRQIAKNLGPTLWRGEWQSPPMKEAAFGIVRAWYDTLLSDRQFLGYDALRHWPVSYPNGFGTLTVGGSPWNGQGSLTTVNADGVTLTIGGLPVGFQLRPGDYLAFDYGAAPSRALHRVVTSANANGSGNITIEVRPNVRVGWAASAVVYFEKPAARMIILPDSYDEGMIGPDRFGRVSFQAVQSL